MRFDLEIPATNNVELTYIREGSAIPNSVAPLIYFDMNTRDIFPSDFISAEVRYTPREYIFGGYEVIQGPAIDDPRGDKFLLTNIVKYTSFDADKIPLFYKHVIDYPIKEDGIRIVDYFGMPLSKELYHVDERSHTSVVYMNKPDKILFIEYVSENKVNRSLLNLIPAFTEAGWGDVVNGEVAAEKYVIKKGILQTSHNETLYVAYLSDTKLYSTATGNIDDPWHIKVLNADFYINDIRYRVPEYYMQGLTSDFRYKLIERKKCRHLFGSLIQSQYPIAENAGNEIDVFVHDIYSGDIKSAFTTNYDLVGTLVKNGSSIYYKEIKDWNLDGVFELTSDLAIDEVAYATHYTAEPYYEYKDLDLNSTMSTMADYIAIYLKPNPLDSEYAVKHVIIGAGNLGSFTTVEEFETAQLNSQSTYYNTYTVAIIKITTNLKDYNCNMIDVRSEGNIISDKVAACKMSIDILYDDIAKNNLHLPLNDAVVATVDIRRLISEGKVTVGVDSKLDEYGKRFLNKVKDVLNKNLDASTQAIVEAII